MLTLNSFAPVLAQATDDWWAEQFFGLDPSQRFALLIVAIGCATAIIISLVILIGCITTAMHRRRLESELKRDMLDRGMSADDIVRVIESAQPKDFLERWAAAQGKGKR
jgi:hypothetical protein